MECTSLGLCIGASHFICFSIFGLVLTYFRGLVFRSFPCGENPGNVPMYYTTAVGRSCKCNMSLILRISLVFNVGTM